MMEIAMPGFGNLRVEHLVCDFNGTLAVDGELLPGVREVLAALACVVRVHVITADTFGRAASQLEGLPVDLTVIPVEAQAQAKLDYISRLGVETVVAIGNGLNDRDMLRAAAMGIALIHEEGASARTLACADIVCTGILDALDLLRKPKRLIATLRS
ncbi:MAG TPA: ATPase P [Deltaproteobacteria bacterium]|nr:ATPase P [Deltaproteobacteria bacterium]